MSDFTHINQAGRAYMVDVSDKGETRREAIARSTIHMKPETLHLIQTGGAKKGDVLGVAQVAAIMAAKKTSEMIPMCHPLLLTKVDVAFLIDEEHSAVHCQATVSLCGKTGVEMEALTAVSVGALTIYDMCKAVDKGMIIDNIRLVKKTGGKSGEFIREDEEEWQN